MLSILHGKFQTDHGLVSTGDLKRMSIFRCGKRPSEKKNQNAICFKIEPAI